MEKEKILAYALENALLHEGKAKADAVIAKLFLEGLRKEEIIKIMPEVKKIAEQVNSMQKNEQEKKFSELHDLIKKRIKKETTLEELPHAEKPIFRIEPSPTGPLHIGHALVLLLNYFYKQRYNGKLILRFGDTNPEEIIENAYEMIIEDAFWLTDKGIDETTYQSDRMHVYYEYALKLIKEGFAYVCICKPEVFKKLLEKGKACECRNLSVNEQLERWQKMLSEYKEEQAVLRIKTDLEHENPAVREWPAFRICTAKHPRQGKKFRVWPLMNFSVAIDDMAQQTTHIIRGKDHIVNTERQRYIFKYLKAKEPFFFHIGRINFKDMKLSTRGTADAIKEKKFSGWDDPRLPFIAALRKRGFHAEAIQEFVKNIGLSKVDKTLSHEEFMKLLCSANKPLIEKGNRYFFVSEPVKIKIPNAPRMHVFLNLHPDMPEKGKREFFTAEEFYVSKNDYKNFQNGKFYRLMNLLNFKKTAKGFEFVSQDIDQKLNARPIHWLPANEEMIKVKILMPDANYVEGLAEKNIIAVKIDETIQFERFGFCKLLAKDECYEFIFTQK